MPKALRMMRDCASKSDHSDEPLRHGFLPKAELQRKRPPVLTLVGLLTWCDAFGINQAEAGTVAYWSDILRWADHEAAKASRAEKQAARRINQRSLDRLARLTPAPLAGNDYSLAFWLWVRWLEAGHPADDMCCAQVQRRIMAAIAATSAQETNP